MPIIREPQKLESPVEVPLPAGGPAVVEERRSSGRIRAELAAQLVCVGATRTVQATATDIGAGGLFVQAPTESELAVGQRYEVVLTDEREEVAELSRFIGEGRFATVVRTERLAAESPSALGAGLRFDHQGEGSVALDVDVLGRVHLDGDFRHWWPRSRWGVVSEHPNRQSVVLATHIQMLQAVMVCDVWMLCQPDT